MGDCQSAILRQRLGYYEVRYFKLKYLGGGARFLNKGPLEKH